MSASKEAAPENTRIAPTLTCADTEREQALEYLRDAAESIVPAMSALERNQFLHDVGFIAELERIEVSLEARRSGEALDRLRRFIRPVWMAGPSGPAVESDPEHQGERGGHAP